MRERTVNLHFDAERLHDDGEEYWEFRLPEHPHAFGIAKTPAEFLAWIAAIVEQCLQSERLAGVTATLTPGGVFVSGQSVPGNRQGEVTG